MVDKINLVNDKVKELLERMKGPASKPCIISKNKKTEKSKKIGVVTATVHLAPHRESVPFGGVNMCAGASEACKKACLNNAGMHVMETHQVKRIALTKILKNHRELFMNRLFEELKHEAQKVAKKPGMEFWVRLQALSDQVWMSTEMSRRFKDAGLPGGFYDYTKVLTKKDPLVFRTFSLSESNQDKAKEALANGMNLAVVFDLKKNSALPDRFWGLPVVDGDEHDAIFRHGAGKQVVVGLRLKGTNAAKKAARDSGFAVNVNNLAIDKVKI